MYQTEIREEITKSPNFGKIWDCLNPLDQWILIHHIKNGKSQGETAILLKLSQPSISYRAQTLVQKIKLLNDYFPIPHQEVAKLIKGSKPHKKYKDEIIHQVHQFLDLRNQTKVAKVCHCSQGRIRHRLLLVRSYLFETYGEDNPVFKALDFKLKFGGQTQRNVAPPPRRLTKRDFQTPSKKSGM